MNLKQSFIFLFHYTFRIFWIFPFKLFKTVKFAVGYCILFLTVISTSRIAKTERSNPEKKSSFYTGKVNIRLAINCFYQSANANDAYN